MPFCPSCGKKIELDIKFCPYCGIQIIQLAEKGQLTYALPELVQRNYLIWYALSLVSSGVFNYLYLYFNFEDLNKLDKYPRASEVTSTAVDVKRILIYIVLLVILGNLFLFPIIIFDALIYYKKYSLLHNYLSYQPQKQTKIPIAAKKYVTLVIIRDIIIISGMTLTYLSVLGPVYELWTLFATMLSVGFLSIFLIALPIGIYLIIQEYRWQEALNERIIIINPNAQKKDLF